ncbi:LOW QUALITY PROTEIN: hypothetical protein HID58_053942 [Brassica napus]|uniref:Uncharacterized protein n=1 Tax=Brassica napus TaxID=3708 RepID=A0ABQ8AGD5_BRANA|nr:LOW QUALITY PROTEIN: hypothetical protein HID58_053942 [Brassica napus]
MSNSQSIAFGFLRFWDSLNFKKDKEFVGITVLFLDEKLKARLQSDKFKCNDIPTTETVNNLSHIFLIPKKSTMFLIYFFIYAILASVMDSYLPRIALTMLLDFKTNQKIYVSGRLIKGILQRSETV